MRQQMFATRLRLVGAFAVFVLLATACNLGGQSPQETGTPTHTSAGGPSTGQPTLVAQNDVPDVQIRSPANNTEVLLSTEVQVYVQAVDKVGVTRIEMNVDGLIVDSAASPDVNGSPALSSILSWTPSTIGPHVVEAVAYRGDVKGNPQRITLTVRDNPAQLTNPAVSPVFLTSSPTNDPSCRVRVNIEGLNLRNGPGVNYEVITTLALGIVVPVIGSNADRSWWQVNASGQVGWVSAPYTTAQGLCSNIMSVQIPVSPTPPPGATPLPVYPTFTPIPVIIVPTVVSIPVVVLPTLTASPFVPPTQRQPSIGDLSSTAIFATETALAQPPTPQPTFTPTPIPIPGTILPTLTPSYTPSITPTPVLPNLIIVAAVPDVQSVITTDPKQPSVVHVRVTVKNVGQGLAPVFDIGTRLSSGLTISAPTNIVLPPNGQADVDLNIPFTLDQQTVTIIADINNVIAETNKLDNIMTVTVKILIATLPGPSPTSTFTFTPPASLTPFPAFTPTVPKFPPTSLTITPVLPNLIIVAATPDVPGVIITDPKQPSVVHVKVTVKNVGQAPAAVFQIGARLAAGTTISASTTGVLPPNGQTAVDLNIPFTVDQQTVTIIADINNVIPETNKLDNVATVTVGIVMATVPGPSSTSTFAFTLTSTPQTAVPPLATRTPTPTLTSVVTTPAKFAPTNTPTPVTTKTATVTVTATPTTVVKNTAVVPTVTRSATATFTTTLSTTKNPSQAAPTATNTNTPTSTTKPATATSTSSPLPPTTLTSAPKLTATLTSSPTMTNTSTPTLVTKLSTATFTASPLPPTLTFTPKPLTATFTPSPLPPTHTFTPLPPTLTFTPKPPTATFTPSPLPPTHTFTPLPPTLTFTPKPPTATFTPSPLPPTHTFTPLPPTLTFTPKPPPTLTFTPVTPTIAAVTPIPVVDLRTVPVSNLDNPVVVQKIKEIRKKSAKDKIALTDFSIIGDDTLNGAAEIGGPKMNLDQFKPTFDPVIQYYAVSFRDLAKRQAECHPAQTALPTPLQCALQAISGGKLIAGVSFVSLGKQYLIANVPPDQLRKDLMALVKELQDRGIVPILVTISGPTNNPTVTQYNQVVYEVATAEHLPLFNLYKLGADNPQLIDPGTGVLKDPGPEKRAIFTPDLLNQFGVNATNLALLQMLNSFKALDTQPQ